MVVGGAPYTHRRRRSRSSGYNTRQRQKKERNREGRSGWRRWGLGGGTFHPADDGGRGRPLFGATTDSGHGENIREWDEKEGGYITKQRRP